MIIGSRITNFWTKMSHLCIWQMLLSKANIAFNIYISFEQQELKIKVSKIKKLSKEASSTIKNLFCNDKVGWMLKVLQGTSDASKDPSFISVQEVCSQVPAR